MNEEFVSTGSRAQDALLKGYQTTCQKGISVLLKSEDRTILACKDIKLDAINVVKKRVEEIREADKNWRDLYLEEIKKFNPIKRFFKKLGYKSVVPDFGELKFTDLVLNVTKGTYRSSIKRLLKNGIEKQVEFIEVRGKFGSVEYDSFNTYSKEIIPDDTIKTIKEAQDMGMEDIQIAYPTMSDGKIVRDDPFVVGYITDKEKGAEMYIIAQFGFKPVKEEEKK